VASRDLEGGGGVHVGRLGVGFFFGGGGAAAAQPGVLVAGGGFAYKCVHLC
jgi:hypothetical protein